MRKTIDEKRDTVAKFIKASAEGFAKCMAGDYEPAMKAVMAMNPEHTAELFHFKIAQMEKYGMVNGGDAKTMGIGAMTEARWKDFFDTMSSAGIYEKSLDWKKAFTLEFVQGKSAM